MSSKCKRRDNPSCLEVSKPQQYLQIKVFKYQLDALTSQITSSQVKARVDKTTKDGTAQSVEV